MDSDVVTQLPATISGIQTEKTYVVILLAAHKTTSNGNVVSVTGEQAESALEAAKSALQASLDTEVLGSSSAFVLPEAEVAENENLTLQINAEIVKTYNASLRD